MAEMKAMGETIPQIKNIWVGQALGYVGTNNTVNMIIDVNTKEDLDKLFNHPAHLELANHAAEVFEVDNFVISQIEIGEN